MGTSGAYGGSGSAAWERAHQVYEQGAAKSALSPEELVAAFVAAIGRANRNTPSTPGSYHVGSIRPSRPKESDGFVRSRTAGTGIGGATGLSGRAARGAAAVAAAQAYRARDAQSLAGLGLDLAALDVLPDYRSRCNAIAEQIMGAPAHPEDAALNAVSIQTMMDVLRSSEELNAETLIERFTVHLAYEQALVELTSQQRNEPVPAAQAAKIERQAKRYIENSLRAETPRPSRRLSAQQMIDKAAALTARVLNIFGRGR